MNTERINEILTYWFGELRNAETYPEEKSKIWFNGGAAVDSYIRKNFEGDLLKASQGKLDPWKETPRGTLALITLLDQFPRNIYRETSKAFAFDKKALGWCLWGMEKSYDNKLFPIERAFFYLPLEHSEDLEIQKKSVAAFTKLVEDSPSSVKFAMDVALDYAQKHFDLIQKFGRFPHRNEILGRSSTSEELEFLVHFQHW